MQPPRSASDGWWGWDIRLWDAANRHFLLRIQGGEDSTGGAIKLEAGENGVGVGINLSISIIITILIFIIAISIFFFFFFFFWTQLWDPRTAIHLGVCIARIGCTCNMDFIVEICIKKYFSPLGVHHFVIITPTWQQQVANDEKTKCYGDEPSDEEVEVEGARACGVEVVKALT